MGLGGTILYLSIQVACSVSQIASLSFDHAFIVTIGASASRTTANARECHH